MPLSRAYEKKYSKILKSDPQYYIPDVSPIPCPAPIAGWNAISPLATMEPTYAVTLENWMPRPGWVELRGGYNNWTQNLASGSPVESLLVYRPAASAERMFAAAGTSLYEVSSYGTYTTELTGLTNARWQYCNFTPSLGSSYLIMCNGVDAVREYNGSVWSTPSITGSGLSSSALFIQVITHQRRLWFVEKLSTRVWYLGSESITGTATNFDVGPLISKGSYVLSLASWTVDGGNGPQSLLVVLTNKGQAVIYQGVDPSSATAFSLVGVFDLATPLGVRCMTKMGSDVIIITNQGVLPLSKALPFNPSGQRSVTCTANIQNAMLEAAQIAPNNFGWETTLFPAQTMMILNVPLATNVQQQQFVMNTITDPQAWCKFTGWNANTFAIFNESLYFGDNDGNVALAYVGRSDLDNPIVADMKCAFNPFGMPGQTKNLSMVKPYLIVDGIITPTIGVDVDFADNSPQAGVVTSSPIGGAWDTATWDTSLWNVGQTAYGNWLSAQALGTFLAVRMKVNYAGSSSGTAGLGIFDTGVFDTAIFDGNGYITSSGQGVPILRVAAFECLMQKGGSI